MLREDPDARDISVRYRYRGQSRVAQVVISDDGEIMFRLGGNLHPFFFRIDDDRTPQARAIEILTGMKEQNFGRVEVMRGPHGMKMRYFGSLDIAGVPVRRLGPRRQGYDSRTKAYRACANLKEACEKLNIALAA